LEREGAKTAFFDPHVAAIPKTRDHPKLAGRPSIKWDAEAIRGYDAVLIATDHDGVDYATLAKHARLIVDTRNACARAGVAGDHVVKA
jgi:UDP-N-acetyl-D-glucosamine dehydrogenase